MAKRNSSTTADPATLEDEVERTQDAIGETVEKLEDRLSPDAMLGENGEEIARDAFDIVRSNPIPVAMIAVGVIWLVATSNSPAVRRIRDRVTGRRDPALTGPHDPEMIPRSEEPAPIGPPPETGTAFDRRRPRG